MMNCFAYDKLTTDGRQRKEKKSMIGTYLSANWLIQKVCYEIHENTFKIKRFLYNVSVDQIEYSMIYRWMFIKEWMYVYVVRINKRVSSDIQLILIWAIPLCIFHEYLATKLSETLNFDYLSIMLQNIVYGPCDSLVFRYVLSCTTD